MPPTPESIQLVFVEPDDIPSTIVILWPRQRSTFDPRDFPLVAATLTRVCGSAATKLAGIKAV